MMKQTVAYARFVYIARLGVADSEMFVPAVAIGTRNEILVESNDIVHQVSCEFLHILSLPLFFYELLPRGEQIFKRDDSVIINTP